MKKREENILNNLVYYTLIAVMVAFVIYFAFNLVRLDIPIWQKVMYYVVVGLLVVNVIVDILSTLTLKYKLLSGIMMYIFTIAMIILNMAVYMIDTVDGVLVAEVLSIDIFLLSVSTLISVFAICIFCIGKKLIANDKTM